MRHKKTLLCVTPAALLMVGCAGTRAISMDVDQPVAQASADADFTLGAGDALGWRVYQQDVYLAMRDGYSRGIYQPSLFPETRMVEVPVE